MIFSRRWLLKALGAVFPFISCRTKDESDNMADIDNDVRPIVLRAETEVEGNSDNEITASPFINATGEPLEIHEFKFSVRPSNASLLSAGLQGLFPSGGNFAVGLSVVGPDGDGHAMTNGPIPMWSFGQSRQLGEEQKIQSFNVTGAFDVTLGWFMTGAYNWKLDHPMYVPPGGRIVPTVRSLGSFNGNVIIGVTAIGKVLPNSPPSKPSYKVPWVTSYVSKSFESSDTGQDSSTDSLLNNPHDMPVTVERFVGRLHCQAGFISGSVLQLSVADTSLPDAADVSLFVQTGQAYYAQVVLMRMRDSMGNPLVREKTLFRNVFNSDTRTWECRHVLPPKQFYKVDFFKTALPALTSFPTTSRVQASVTAVGWREVSWKKAA